MKRLAIVLIGIFLSCLAITGRAELESGQVLALATKAFKETSWQAVMAAAGRNQNHSYMYYQRVNPDGTVDSLMKSLEKRKGATSFLVNAKGRFEIIGDTAIRTDYVEEPPLLSPVIAVLKNKDTIILNGSELKRAVIGDKNFSRLEQMAKNGGKSPEPSPAFRDITMEKINYHGISCYLIKYKLETADGFLWNEEIIDARNFLPYQIRQLNARGSVLSVTTYSDIIINPVFEEGLFELPRGVKITVAKTLDDGIQKSKTALDKATPPPGAARAKSGGPRWITALMSSINNFFWRHSMLISYSLLSVAILSLMVLGMIKLRHRT